MTAYTKKEISFANENVPYKGWDQNRLEKCREESHDMKMIPAGCAAMFFLRQGIRFRENLENG